MSKKKQDNTLPVLTHIIGYFTSFIGPLIILLATEDPYVKNHARYALNWQLSKLVYALIMAVLVGVFIMTVILIPIILIIVLVGFGLAILDIAYCIMAAIRASEGTLWRYPLSIQFAPVKE